MNKIETIIAALQFASDNSDKTNFEYHIIEKALAAARELRDLTPVGYMDKNGILFNDTTHPQLHTPLYSLEADNEST